MKEIFGLLDLGVVLLFDCLALVYVGYYCFLRGDSKALLRSRIGIGAVTAFATAGSVNGFAAVLYLLEPQRNWLGVVCMGNLLAIPLAWDFGRKSFLQPRAAMRTYFVTCTLIILLGLLSPRVQFITGMPSMLALVFMVLFGMILSS